MSWFALGDAPMGNRAGKNKGSEIAVMRVQLDSDTAVDKTTKVQFKDMKPNYSTYTRRPQMVEVGVIHTDVFRGVRGRFQKSQTFNRETENQKATASSNSSVTPKRSISQTVAVEEDHNNEKLVSVKNL